MKNNKNLLITILLVIVSVTVIAFKNATDDWGKWSSPNVKYEGLEVRVRRGDYNPYSKKWQWDLQFRNRYTKKVTYSYGCVESYNRNNCKLEERNSIEANETDTYTYSFLLNEANTVFICLDKVEFGD